MSAVGAQRQRLQWDPVACDGRGLCAELFPERIDIDEWGFPIVSAEAVPPALLKHAQRTIAACPTLALRLVPAAPR